MTTIRDVEIAVVLGRLRAGKRFHYKAPAASGFTVEEAIGFDERAPDGEELLTLEDMPSEEEIIAEWEAMQAERDAAQASLTVHQLSQRARDLESIMAELLMGDSL